MGKKQINLVIVLLLVILLIVILQQYFLIKKYLELESNKFNFQTGNFISQAFFQKPLFKKNLDTLSERLLKRIENKPDKEEVLEHLRKELKVFGTIGGEINNWLIKQQMDIEYKYSIIVSKYSLITPNREITLLNSSDSEDIVPLFGDLKRTGKELCNNMFFYKHQNHLLQVDIYVNFINSQKYLFLKIKGTLISALLSIFLAIGIFIFTVKTILKQKKLSQMKTDFIDNITHELNTPISTIGVATNNLQLEGVINDFEKIKEIAQVIYRQNNRLQKIIQNVMDLSFSERSKERLNYEKININGLIEEILYDFKLQYTKKNFHIHSKYCIEEVLIPVDKEKITIAFVNILENSFKYCKEIPKIRVLTNRTDKFFNILFIDNGPGIKKTDQKKIFSKFFRVQNGNIHDVKGLGIGLYWVKCIIKAHQGKIEVESKFGSGTTFCISLPIPKKGD